MSSHGFVTLHVIAVSEPPAYRFTDWRIRARSVVIDGICFFPGYAPGSGKHLPTVLRLFADDIAALSVYGDSKGWYTLRLTSRKLADATRATGAYLDQLAARAARAA